MAELTSTNIYGNLTVTRDLIVLADASLGSIKDTLYITNSKVGVLNSSPTYTLDVTGSGRFTSTLYTSNIRSTTSGTVDIGASGSNYYRHGYFSGTVYSDDNLSLNWSSTPQVLDANDTGIYTTSPFSLGGTPVASNAFQVDGGHSVFNDDSGDYDFRVESNTNTHAIFVDGGNSFMGMNLSTPNCTLNLGGSFRIDDSAERPNAGTGLEFYFDNSIGYIHPYDRTGGHYAGSAMDIRGT